MKIEYEDLNTGKKHLVVYRVARPMDDFIDVILKDVICIAYPEHEDDITF